MFSISFRKNTTKKKTENDLFTLSSKCKLSLLAPSSRQELVLVMCLVFNQSARVSFGGKAIFRINLLLYHSVVRLGYPNTFIRTKSKAVV